MTDSRLTVDVQRYDPSRGVVADVEGGTIVVTVEDDEVSIVGDAAGLRDLARWCLAFTDPAIASPGAHVHLDPNVTPLAPSSVPLRIELNENVVERP